MNFKYFLQNRQKVGKQHFSSENEDAEYEKEVFLHIGLVLTKIKMISYSVSCDLSAALASGQSAGPGTRPALIEAK
jgi:hypothetical protein